MESYYHRLQAIFISSNRWLVGLAVVALCLLIGLVGGALIAYLSPVLTAALVVAIAAGLVMLRSAEAGIFALVGVICLLPFAVLPIKIGFSPTLLDLVLGVLFVVWLAKLLAGRAEARLGRASPRPEFVASPLALPVLAFILLAFVSFVVGLGHASPSASAVRRFAEIIIGIALFFVTVNCIRTRRELERVTVAIVLAGFVEAVIGVVLYFLPRMLTVRLLSALRVVGYPAGWGVLRFIRDDPRLPMRAIATSVDPNILGGLMILVAALAVPQLFTRQSVLKRAWVAPMLAAMGLCLFLTYSRGSFAALGIALTMLGLIKYRRLLLVLALAGLVIVLLPQTQGYIQHFLQGVRLQDLATKMRLGEYKDALILIHRYPLLGVGFVGTPDIDIYIGVSSLYLLIAEEMGLVGLGVFLIAIAIFFAYTWRARRSADPRLEAIILGLQTAIVAGLIGGLFDHYLFSYPHMAAFFWLYVGLAVVAARLGLEKGAGDTPAPPP